MNRKVIFRAYLLCWIFLALAIISKSLGLYSFMISTETKWFIDLCKIIDSNAWLYRVISFIFSFITVNLLYACMVDDYRSKYKRMMLYAIPMIIAKNVFVINGINFMFYIVNVLIVLLPIKFDSSKLRIGCIVVIDMLFQVMSMSLVRDIDLMSINSNIVVYGIYMIDYYIMLALLLMNIKMKGDASIWNGDYGSYAQIYQNLKKSLRLSRINLKEMKILLLKLKLGLSKYLKKKKDRWIDLDFFINYQIKPTVIILTPLGLYTIIVDKTYEFVMFMIAYVWIREAFSKTFHADHIPGIKTQHVMGTCTVLSTFLFTLVINELFPAYKTIFSTIIIALIVDYILYFVKDYIDLYLFKVKHTQFRVSNCSKEDLIARCEMKGLNREEMILALQLFHEKKSISDVAVALTIEKQSVSNKKLRLKNKLENPN